MMSTSPKSSLAKLGLHSNKSKTFKVLIIGHSGVGKTAMVVRFITKRFIGSYDSSDEKIYSYTTVIDNEIVAFDIADRPGHFNTTDMDKYKNAERKALDLETQCRWADAFILVYSVTDKCSFDECNRLKFLINYNKRRRKLTNKESLMDVPVILVGNKNDQWGDRMVSNEEGYRRSKEISCVCFHEISARESAEQVMAVFRDATRYWRVLSKSPKLKRSTSETASELAVSPDPLTPCLLPIDGAVTPTATTPPVRSEKRMSMLFFGRLWAESSPDENDELQTKESNSKENGPFRERASTDGTLLSRPRRWRFPPPTTSGSGSLTPHPRSERRMSISLRGSNTNSSY
ncbi:ras-related and estrogen-regulated growth inhibitor isoform X1 [Lutzomyia longipalpis]|uniref:ras-related and estrogen-regulated growth inhibitor isoform X1 n=2 Tax=Lutzomyia longipalpis TaxID=7200 RepID=UPI0024834C5E|nr:ras-related and estrogen-regulated growth inhibitor isoform X1 [Lutzomyia longipalpis]